MLSRDQAKSKLLESWRNPDLKFLAEYKIIRPSSGEKKPHGAFYLKKHDKQLLYPLLEGYEFSRTAWVFSPLNPELIDGETYQIVVDIADDQFRERSNRPFQLKIVDIFKIEQSEDYMSAKNFIAYWFGKKGESPGDAASIAGQLRLNQLELYTQTKRFIFELIQNADDMPVPGRPVEIEIRLLESFFIFRHNGQYFSRGDVKAISDAAKSTKRADETKTGYKGIGFKSVFSDSETVFILSQDYSFKFDKSAAIYKDFKELYRPNWSRFSVDEQIKFFKENKAKEKEHTNIENIPWQIKPIWTELADIPEEVRPYFSKAKNVNIALNVGASKITEKRYDEMIVGLVNDPRFLLFLRNARKIDYWPPAGPMKTIEVRKTEGVTEVLAEGQLMSAYRTFDAEIAINNEAFEKAGMNFKHVQLEEDKFAFKDANDNILNNIPEKLGRLKTTILSFAVKIAEGKIEKVPESESILYNYLPTSDQRYRFPFIINADFISKTDREGILSENIWNHYLFFNIGYELTKWLRNLSNNKSYRSSYLNVLPDILLDENHEDLGSIDAAFNKGLSLGISETGFIPNSSGVKSLVASLMIDDTGLAEVIGWPIFSDFTGTTKSLVDPLLDKRKLKTRYLGIEVFGFKDLRENLKDPIKRGKFNESLKTMDAKGRERFIAWLDKACEKELTFADISSLTFIRLGWEKPEFVDIIEFQSDKSRLFRSELTGKLFPQLKKIDRSISSFNIDDYPDLLAVLVRDNNTYLANDKLIYSRITALFSEQLTKLNAEDRKEVLEILRTLEGIEIGTIAKLSWFRNSLGEFKTLAELYDNEDFIYPSSFNGYFIHHEDKHVLGKAYTDFTKGLADLLKLDEFFIDVATNGRYDEGNTTVDLLSRLLKKGDSDNNIYPLLAKKIRLDGNTIDGDLFLDTITVTFINQLNQSVQTSFKLRELLPDISEGSKNVSTLLEKLAQLTDAEKEVLRTKVFVLKAYNSSLIESGILVQTQELSYDQFLYLLIPYWFNKQTSARKLKLSAPNPLTKADGDSDDGIRRLLDFMYENKVANTDYQIEYEGSNYPLISKGTIICDEEDLVFDTEIPDDYLVTWMDGNDDKKKFLVEKGALDETYSHILFRQAIRDEDIENLEELTSDLHTTNHHFINTARFLEDYETKGDVDFSWCGDQIVAFYNKFAGMKTVNFDTRRFPVYSDDEQEIFRLELLNKDRSYFKKQASWGIYKAEVGDHVFGNGDFLISENLVLPPGYKAISANITEKVDIEKLVSSSDRFDATFYKDWHKYEEHVINIFDGYFIPFQVIFEGKVLAEGIGTGERVLEEKNTYYVCARLKDEIPFCLKTMSSVDAMSLVHAKLFPKNSGSNSKNNDELSKEEIQELERLFRRKLSSTELSSHWLIACFKAMKHYKKQGYDVSYAEHNFESSIKKKMLEKVRSGDEELCILPRSAKQNLLRITLNAWNALEDDSTELFVLTSTGHQVFSNHSDLMDSSDNLLFTIATDDKDDKMKIVASLFEQESIYDSQYDSSVQVVLLIQLSGGSMFNGLFSSFSNNSKISDF
jgi:hypothetical protein